MWSEDIKELGRAMDVLQSELAKQYRNKGGKVDSLVKKTADVLAAVFKFIKNHDLFDAVMLEVEKRKKEVTP